MILIADSGSTKTNWALIANENFSYFDTEGYNPYYMDSNYIRNSVLTGFDDLAVRRQVKQVYFYCAGFSSATRPIVESALGFCFENAEITIEGDLLAAARCLLGKEKGFAAILGTGTNTCFYDGERIVEIVDSLGFLAGDEGSGSYIGKQLIKAYVRKSMPIHLYLLFEQTFKMNSDQVIAELYGTSSPNKFAAGFTTFAGQNIDDDFVKALVKSSLRDFFSGIIVHYKNYHGSSISFVGSVAFAFLPMLATVTEDFGMRLGKVIKSPLADLIAYHLADRPKALS
ncbi:MAG: N-acetylglucosamine kinase [Pedobacter sp.]|nr:MAG: N-acetylglucosamine kinase [Pedobacter sp.]